MDPREHWRQVYEAKRPEEVSWYQVSPQPSLHALKRSGAEPSMSIVDIGAGASTLADKLIERGWNDITLVDIAEPALEATRLRLAGKAARIQWQVADMLHWMPARTFDIWHDRAVFHFLTGENERLLYKRALRQGTHSGSRVIVATFALEGPEMCSGLPVRRYDAGSLAAELGDDFSLVDDWKQTHVTPRGAEQHFQWCIFTRR